MNDKPKRGEVRHIGQGDASVTVPPYSIVAEQAVIGAVMISAGCWAEIEGIVDAEDFYRKDHQLIWAALERLAEKQSPLDVITLSDAMETARTLDECGGLAYLSTLAKDVPSATNAKRYAEIVREKSDLRRLIVVGVSVTEKAYRPNGASIDDLIAQSEAEIYSLAQRRERAGSGPIGINEASRAALDQIEAAFERSLTGQVYGLSTGFAALDEEIMGLRGGDFVIVAGRPSMGKTSFAMQIAQNAALNDNKAVAVFSLEMPAEQLSMRMLASVGRIPVHRLKSGRMEDDDWPRLVTATGRIGDLPIQIDDTGAISVSEIRSRCRRLARRPVGLDLIVIDYIQLAQARLSGNNHTKNDEVTAISGGLKALAKELNVPIIALSQLNRGLEQRTDKRPMMSDLRDSGSIEQDADVILFLYRDEVYSKGRCKEEDKGIAEIIISKQRNGPIGTVRLRFEGEYTRFEPWMPPGPGDYASGGY